MPAPTACQLLLDPPAAGAWNMAVDEVLLDAVASTGMPTLRFYQWERPTLSLGYFQRAEDRALHTSSQQVDLVRRLSGGGAILHDRELTYSLILPPNHDLARNTQSLYNTVHLAIIAALGELLVTASSPWQAVLCQSSMKLPARDEPFLCFQRRAVGDILLTPREADRTTPEHKVVGSAQRRRRGVVLQHGSVLLNLSQIAPELPGIADTTQIKISLTNLMTRLIDSLGQALSFELRESSLHEEYAAKARELQSKKYQSRGWTNRR